jgi:predicted kinase
MPELVGVSGSGKSTFARKRFEPTEILSSDYCRGLVSDDENSQAATFDVLHFIARKRLAAGKLTVVDATNVQPESRKPFVEIGRKLVFVGDLVDRGPKIPQVFKLVRNAVTSGAALCVPVNTT